MARISPGTMTAAIFAILVGLAGAYTVRQYLSHPEQAPAAAQMVIVPMAASDLIAGRAIAVNDVALVSMTPEQFRTSKYANMQFMTSAQQIAGRTLKDAVKKGDVFLTTGLYPEGMGPGLAELLKPGQRAVTVSIENIGAVEGFARPGTIVDVLYRSDAANNLPEVTLTLLDRVEVLAVGKTTVPGQTVNVGGDRPQDQKGSVTLAVSPDQAKALKVVEGRGELTLALRSPSDVGEVSNVLQSHNEKLTLYRLLGLPEKTVRKMDIYLGGVKNTIVFGDDAQNAATQPISNPSRTPIASGTPTTIPNPGPPQTRFSTTAAPTVLPQGNGS